MKGRYVSALAVILFIGAALVIILLSSPHGDDTRIGNAIRAAAVTVALSAAVIALDASDPSLKAAEATMEAYISNENSIKHVKAGLSGELARAFDHLPDPFTSYRVHFRIKNKSGFTLVAPARTFRLPLERRHLHSVGATQIANFNSNLFNSQENVRILQFGDTQVLSNNNLPYWNDGEEIEIWIRMTLEPNDFHPFDVGLSLNAENASGLTKNITISAALRRA